MYDLDVICRLKEANKTERKRIPGLNLMAFRKHASASLNCACTSYSTPKFVQAALCSGSSSTAQTKA